MSGVAHDLCLIRSMKTDEINHGSAELFLHSGRRQVERPSFGAWASYGLGTENRNLPCSVVLTNGLPVAGSPGWGAGFLPAEHQAVRFRSGREPVFYLDNPPGVVAGALQGSRSSDSGIDSKFEATWFAR